jgi:hypothetical protein
VQQRHRACCLFSAARMMVWDPCQASKRLWGTLMLTWAWATHISLLLWRQTSSSGVLLYPELARPIMVLLLFPITLFLLLHLILISVL